MIHQQQFNLLNPTGYVIHQQQFNLLKSIGYVMHQQFNLLKTKRNLLYIRNQFVPRSKHFPSRL